MTESINVVGGLIIAGITVFATWWVARHKPKVDRSTVEVAEKQLALDSLRAVSSAWREYGQVQLARAEAAEKAAQIASRAADDCRNATRLAENRAAQLERRYRILVEQWPVDHPLPEETLGEL